MDAKKIIISIIIFSAAFVAGKYAYDFFFNEPEIASFETVDWRTRILTDAGVTMQAPFDLDPINIEVPAYVKQMLKSISNYKYESKAIGVFVSKAEYKEDVEISFEGAVNGALNGLKNAEGVTDFKHEITDIRKNYLNGKQIKGSFKIKDHTSEFLGEMYRDRNKLLQILCVILNFDENREIRDKIMKSIRIKL